MAVQIKTLPEITVVTAGTAVPLIAASTLCYGCSIQSLDTNTGTQYFGDSTVVAGNGIKIKPGDVVEVDAPIVKGLTEFDLSQIFVNATVNASKFRVVAWIRAN